MFASKKRVRELEHLVAKLFVALAAQQRAIDAFTDWVEVETLPPLIHTVDLTRDKSKDH